MILCVLVDGRKWPTRRTDVFEKFAIDYNLTAQYNNYIQPI